MKIRLRFGVYWDELNIERPCAILEVVSDDGLQRVGVVDARTGVPIPDPPSAIPIEKPEPSP